MPRRLLALLSAPLLICWLGGIASGIEPSPLPKVADGWSIALVKEAPGISYPSAIVVARDGTIYLGQDPMNMPGPVTEPIDSVLAIRPDGTTKIFASKLQSVMGLEWVDGTLIVVHAPFLSSFRDTNGDGVSDVRIDLVTGFGPAVPGETGLNDHIASGVRLGIDGFLYVSLGDKGIPLARGTDGRTITLSTGGVVRVRPDGTDLEVVSSGERNPLSVALSARDDIFTFGNDDDSHLWPNSLTHHIFGGHYGYPYEFRDAPHRALPIMAGQTGGAGAQGICSNDAGLPARFRGNLFFCDWGLQAVARYELETKGATFRVVRREPIVERGDLADFRPFSIAPTSDGTGFWMVDWAFNGWLGGGLPTGRLFRLTYTGPDRQPPRQRSQYVPRDETRLRLLGDPTLAVRLENQRALAARPGDGTVNSLTLLLAGKPAPAVSLFHPEGLSGDPMPLEPTETIQLHALWTLDAINTPMARATIRTALTARTVTIRAQAARSAGIRRDPVVESALVRLLGDADPVVRREAAIALGRLGKIAPATRLALYGRLIEADPTVAWSVRRAIRAHGLGDPTALAGALGDPARRDAALTLADGWYKPEVVRVLVATLAQQTSTSDPRWRSRVLAALGGLYAQVPAWSGSWFGSNPLAGPKPMPTEAWDPPSSDLVLTALGKGLRDGDAGVRRQAIIACLKIGPRAIPLLRAMLEPNGETDSVNLLALVRYLGEQKDAKAVAGLARTLANWKQSDEVRMATLGALEQLTGPAALNARLMVLYETTSPAALIARALPALGRGRVLPSNDLIGFLDHKSEAVRAAALGAFPTDRPLAKDIVESIMLHADDPSPEVRVAFVRAIGTYKIRVGLPNLVALANDPDRATRVEATRALALMPDRSGLPAFAAALKDRDPDLRRVGLTALTAIRAEVIPDLTTMANAGEFVGPSALAVERLLANFRPLTDWRVIGPFPRACGPIFADARALDFDQTATGSGGQPVAWKPRLTEPKTGLVILDDLAATVQDPQASPLTAFAVAEVASSQDRSALLVVDATGPTLVTVGDRLLAQFAGGANSETVQVDLKSGVNRVLLRTRQAGEPWSIRVALAEATTPNGLAARPNSVSREGLRAFAFRVAGDPKNGATLFRESSGIQCARCHGVDGTAATHPGLGPDLSGLASRYDKTEIIRSILEPSDRIAPGFHPLIVEQRDGTNVAGLLAGEAADRIELLTRDGHRLVIPRSQISQQSQSAASLMPEGLVDGLSPVEFADLIAYLMSLKTASGMGESAR